MADIVLASSLFKDSVMFGKLQANVASVLGQSGLDARRFIVIAQRVVAHNPRLLQCTALSVASSIMEAAIWGLDLNPAAGQAYMVPYNSNIEGSDGKTRKIMEATLQVGYKGFETLAWREANILMPSACVYHGDKFHFSLGSRPSIDHEPKMTDGAEHRKLIAVYARAIFPDGRELICVHDMAEIERRRKCSKAANGDAWTRFYDAMARKGPIRQLGASQIPYSFAPRLQQAATADEYRESGVSAQLLPEAEDAAHTVVGESSTADVSDGETPPSPDSPSAPADWFPKPPPDNCQVGPQFFDSIESRSKGSKSWYVLTTSDGNSMSSWEKNLADSVPLKIQVLAAWTENQKEGKMYRNLVAIKSLKK